MFNVYLLGLVSLLTDISSEMVYPLLPIFLTSTLGASPAIIGVIEGIAESLASLLKVVSGYWGDKTKKKKELAIAGYGSSFIGKFFLILATSWASILLARIIDRLGKGIRTAPRDAIIADSAKKNQRGHAFGLHRALDTFGAIIGITIAYFLFVNSAHNFVLIFWISMIPALLGVIALFFIKQPKSISAKSINFSFSWSNLDTRLKAFLILAFVFNLGNSSNQFLLLRASNLGVSAPVVILLYLAYNISYGFLSYPAGRLSDKVGRRTLLVLGYFTYAIVYFAFAKVQSQSTLWSIFIIYGIYIALTEGVEKALLTDIAPSNHRGTVLGLHATLVGAALLPASFIAGILWDKIGPSAPFYFGSGMGLIAAIGLMFILHND